LAKFSRRFIWLKNLFPPATAINIQPGEFGEDVSPVHQVLNGTDRLGQFFEFTGNGAAAATVMDSGAAPANKYWFVFACSLDHNDPVARELRVSLRTTGAGTHGLASSGATANPTNQPITVPRAFIIPPRVAIRGESDAMAAGQFLRMRFLYLELDLGEPAPPSP